jgi:hypothetical protein
LGLKKQMPSTTIQYVAVFLKRFQAGIGQMFEKFDSGEGIAFERTSCFSD